jgi:hypothetical protein
LANRIRFGAAFPRQTCEVDIQCCQAAPTPLRRWNARHFDEKNGFDARYGRPRCASAKARGSTSRPCRS